MHVLDPVVDLVTHVDFSIPMVMLESILIQATLLMLKPFLVINSTVRTLGPTEASDGFDLILGVGLLYHIDDETAIRYLQHARTL